MTIPQTSYRLIALTQNKWAVVDADLYLWLTQWKWQAHWDLVTKNFYARRSFTLPNGTRTATSMQRQILGLEYGNPLTADHINGDSLDNRRANLRTATQVQQQMNRGVYKTSRSGVKGVTRKGKKWQVRVRSENAPMFYQLVDNFEDARAIAEREFSKAHGEFARDNSQGGNSSWNGPRLRSVK